MHNLGGVYIIWYRDMLRFQGNRIRMIGSIFLPLLFLFIFGSGLGSQMGAIAPGVNYAQFIFPGIIGMTVLTSSFMAGISLVWDREFGFLKEILVAPINRAVVAAGKTLGAATVSLIQGAIILIFAPLVGVSLSPSTVAILLALMFLLAVAMSSFGVLLATRIKSIEAFQAVTQLLLFPMIFLSGVFIPLQGMPHWMSILTKISPATYGIVSLRQIVLRETSTTILGINLLGHNMSLWNNVGVLAVFGVIMILLAMYSFSRQE
ncbi:MAG: ABC transporter permease [Dehalococcoidales bacterium]|nr:ABC transporter permease [Dehalococcoidales bacterium]